MRSRSDAQSSTVEQLHAQAREDYRTHNSPENQAAAREQAGHAHSHGNAAASAWQGHQ
ncbi:hypothetical protein OIU91_28160 [Streptomyces sp. NBC_01456]|uniref:hypothetical protein n=1 Tax=unclassified Streptomyces TaxID=2593676 RepID=UPI002E31744B|nr:MULTISPECIES: hypothetical protein [unclassified Streptomyces]